MASSKAPATPSTKPTQLVVGTRSPPRRVHSASHMGMVVMTVAMSPEPMPCFCANTTRFMDTNTISPPTSAALRHWRQLGSFSPRHRAQASMITPASVKRVAFIHSGGKLCTATPMAK